MFDSEKRMPEFLAIAILQLIFTTRKVGKNNQNRDFPYFAMFEKHSSGILTA
jgi:hypothetical protein